MPPRAWTGIASGVTMKVAAGNHPTVDAMEMLGRLVVDLPVNRVALVNYFVERHQG
jgi:hypothetical protein